MDFVIRFHDCKKNLFVKKQNPCDLDCYAIRDEKSRQEKGLSCNNPVARGGLDPLKETASRMECQSRM